MNTVVFLSLIIWAALLCADETRGEKDKEGYHVCASDVCLKRALRINGSLNASVNPCEDFYSYACGGQNDARQLSFDSLQETAEDASDALLTIMENLRVGEECQNITDKLGILYKACKATETRDYLEGLLDVMEDAGFQEWPMIAEHTGCKNFSNYIEALLRTGPNAFLDLNLARSSVDLKSIILQIEETKFPLLPRDILVFDYINGGSEAYCNDVDGERLDEDDDDAESGTTVCTVMSAYKRLIAAAVKIMRPGIKSSELEKITGALLDFEKALAKCTAPPEEMYEDSADSPNTTIEALEETFPQFPLLQLLNKRFSKANITLHKNDSVEFYASYYYKKMIDVIMRTEP